MRPRFSRLARWSPSVFWMALIFQGSSDMLSSNHTSRFLEPFLRWFFHGGLSAQGFETIHYLVRKAGHVSEYALLCVLFWWAWRPPESTCPSIGRWRRELLAVFLAVCFAASDEFHQSFVPTREASGRDVLIDTCGAVLGLTLLLTTRASLRLLRQRRNQAGTGSEPSLPG